MIIKSKITKLSTRHASIFDKEEGVFTVKVVEINAQTVKIEQDSVIVVITNNNEMVKLGSILKYNVNGELIGIDNSKVIEKTPTKTTTTTPRTSVQNRPNL